MAILTYRSGRDEENLYPSFKEMVEHSEDPFDTAIRLAIDDSRKLRNDLEHAQRLLYIGDNWYNIPSPWTISLFTAATCLPCFH